MITDWEGATIIDRANQKNRQLKEAIWIRKTKTPMNRDEGSYELPNVYGDDIHQPTCNIRQEPL